MMTPDNSGFETLQFDNSFIAALPADPVATNTPRQVRDACYTRVIPAPVAAPRLLAWTDAVGESLGLMRPTSDTGLAAAILGGNCVLPGMAPYAARYGGHQFGHWAGQLGDGRAITLGEVIGPDGQRRELQLKGAGLTPYSRTADGRAVLRSSLREFLCSEAMHGLGVPTTRALSLVDTGEKVERDMFYDGNPEDEPGAVVCRVAPSFVRFGNFEILTAQDEGDLLKRLSAYVMRTHYPELGAPSPASYAAWFEEICRRTAIMMAHWMRVGFVHGVMNTDNMSILGLTIDYGPYGWLEGYDLRWTPNTTDAEGRRYCYGNQPAIAHWNLTRLASALAPLFDDPAPLHDGLKRYATEFEAATLQAWADKLGLRQIKGGEDSRLLEQLNVLLHTTETDMTIFFRRLAQVPIDTAADTLSDAELTAPLRDAFYDPTVLSGPHQAKLADWLRQLLLRVRWDAANAERRRQRMNRANPKYVARNYLAQEAIDALLQGDTTMLGRLMRVLQRPYDEQPENEDLAVKRPEWARHRAGCSALSCSS